MTARLTVYEDMFVHSNEHSDLKLIVEGQDIHVKKGVSCDKHRITFLPTAEFASSCVRQVDQISGKSKVEEPSTLARKNRRT